MTTIEKFVEFAQTLSGKDRADVEAVLDSMMLSHSNQSLLTPEQEEENNRRFADPNPQYATREEMTAIFGKPFPA